MANYDYDLICIGSGSASGAAAYVAKKTKTKVAIVEARKDMLGGHCPNYACVPTKALLYAGEILRKAKKAGEFGIEVPEPKFDFEKIAAYRDEIINTLTGPRIERNLHNAGIDLLWGEASFVSDHELRIADKIYSAKNIVIGTGSKEFIPPIEGLDKIDFWTSDDAVRLKKLPSSIIIIGAGPVGTEFSQIFFTFGVAVTLLQRDIQILQREDKESADFIQAELEKNGVQVVTGMEVLSVGEDGGEKKVFVKVNEERKEFRAEALMIATGRRANLQPLNLEAAGVETDEKGRLKLNEYLQTTQKHIFAAGDAAGAWQFTHTAAYEGDLVGRQICCGEIEKVNYEVVPRVTFVDPEVASVGMTEAAAKDAGMDFVIARYKIGNLGRAIIQRERRGFVKIIANAKDNLILGGHIVGPEAGQLIHEIAVAMKTRLSAAKLGRVIHAYPTFSEAVAAAGEQLIP